MTMVSNRSENQAILLVFSATIFLAFKGIFAKFAYMVDMSVEGVLLLRFGIAAPLFWIAVYYFTKGSAPLSWVQWRACIAAGLMFFFATYCDFSAISTMGVSISRLILFTFPAIVMMINALLVRTMPSLKQFTMFVITYFGIALVMAPKGMASLDGFDWVGAGWAMGSAVTYAIYLIMSQQILKTLGSVRFTAASGSVTLICMLVMIPISHGFGAINFTVEGFLWGSAIAVVCTFFPFILLSEGIRRCGATQASLISLTGPITTVFLAWFFLDETLSGLQLIGAALTILGVASLKTGWVIEALVKFFKRKVILE
jgi:drug/metabolite transporter (DMT)-like permease